MPAAKGIKEAAAANAFMYMMAENARPIQTCQVRLTGVNTFPLGNLADSGCV
jgi:hypothetical protein